ncbi:MAG: glycine--tRNA ligase subunit beta [Burkholderiaceae bacterium]|jgi:glycyl-tRNA synthetase beta chain|nr:glycine--tRNA ligase subunit beta [Burkholderiaceae bacterium]
MSGNARNLLVELFVEELPPKALKKLGEAFGAALLAGLKAAGLAGEQSALNVFASPRRLGARISHVLPVAPERAQSVKLMPVAVGLAADGSPTPALLKKLVALGADAGAVPGLRRAPDGKAEALFLDSTVPGATLAAGLQAALDEALARLPIPKVMQYQLADGWQTVHFVRPAHGLVALHGADVVPVRALGLVAGRQTRGHRIEAAVDPVVLQDADHYERQLAEQGAVIAGFAERRAELVRQLQHAAALQNARPVDDDALLDEVTALVERPNVLVCEFPAPFLAVPPECLILTMKANQKYFPLLDDAGRLTNRFLVVSNIRPADPSRVVEGNERVVKPRLADARFFFDQDRKRTLDSRVPQLGRVVYHGKLGSQGERVERVRAIAGIIGRQLGGDALAALADRAARLAKADLLTDMVGEFPELQGIMGGYYARHDGEPEAVAWAVEDHYKPRFAGDVLPRGQAGVVVALADKLETLAGLFGIGERPTGDKDPFALRRHALGVIRMLIERDLAVDLQDLIDAACRPFGPVAGWVNPSADIERFLKDRLVVLLRDQGYTAQEVDAVAERLPARWGEIPRRLAAVRAFAALPEAAALAAANKRVGNILKKAEGAVPTVVDAALLGEAAEQALAAALQRVAPEADAAFEHGDHTRSLQLLAQLKAPVDAFFDAVMVNADDPALRANRLALLGALQRAMNRVADLSRLAA